MLRFGVIGAGAWGLNHVRVVENDPRCELIAVADPNPAARQRAKSLAPNVRTVGDPDQLVEDAGIDVVVIASPAPTHASLACAAIRGGKHVLIEKPMAMNVADARAIVDLARAASTVVMVGHLMVYHPAVVRLRELLHSGALGKLHYLHSTRVNLGRIRSDENALWSFGPHDLSMIDFLLERMPQSIAARGQRVLQPGVEDVVFLTLRYETGEMAHIHLSWLNPRKERRLTLVCSQRMVEFDDVAAEKLRISDKGYDLPPEFTHYAQYLTQRDGDVLIPRLSMQEPLQLQLEALVTSIHDRRPPTSNAESGLRVTTILEAAQRSLGMDGIPITLEAANLVDSPAIPG